MIEYITRLDGVTTAHLDGFFEGWPNPPSAETHLAILARSHRVVLAREVTSRRIVGFVNAISDGVLSAYIPLLEVLPSHRDQGIGTELMQRILRELDGLYMTDLTCDEPLVPFYRRLGLQPARAMMRRRRDRGTEGLRD
jgi:GNAT superfamily N-acetyltransferase